MTLNLQLVVLISMGDVDGAAKAAIGQVDGVGLTGLQDQNELLYVNGATDVDGDATDDTIYPNPAALYEFSTGAFSFYAGAGDPAGGIFAGVLGQGAGAQAAVLFTDQTYSFGAKWGDNGYSVGLGFETARIEVLAATGSQALVGTRSTVSQALIGGSAEFGDFTVKGSYGAIDSKAGTGNQWALSGTYAMDALSVTAYYSSLDLALAKTVDAYGLGAAYDLGGGLSVKGGIAQNRAGDTIGDLGVSMSF